MNAQKTGTSSRGTTESDASQWRTRLIWAAVTVVSLGLIVWLALSIASEEFVTGVPEGTQQIAVESSEHVEGDIYEADEVPPGGRHNPIWQNCGFYDAPIRAENAVHSLEHGAVWITHSADLPAKDVDVLRGFVGSASKVLVSPVADQRSPVTLSAWGNQLMVDDVNDPRVEQFVNEFTTNPSGPEPGGRCSGGVGEPSF